MANPAGTAARAKRGPKATKHDLPGRNGPSDAELIEYVQGLVRLNAERDALRARINAFRKAGKALGIELKEMDERIRQSDWTPEEIKTHWATSLRYAEVLGQPVGTQLALFGDESTPDAIKEAVRWRATGRMHGMLGKGSAEKPPEGCPPEARQPYGEGWVEGQAETQRTFLEKQTAGTA